MKNFLNLMLILISTITLGQPTTDSISLKVDSNTEKAILKEMKYIDSVRALREKEIAKQDKMIKDKTIEKATIKRLENNKKIVVKYKKNRDQYLDRYAVKNDSKAVYWEEIPRTWFGRQITGTEVIRREYFFENGKKIYKE